MRLVRITKVLLCASLGFTAASGGIAKGQTGASADESLASAEAALRQHNTSEAIHLLKDALKRSPDDQRLRVELGKAYLYKGQDGRAIRIFREVLSVEPANRSAKLELAKLLAKQHHYRTSDQLYRELIATDANDEAASIGLVHDLMMQHRIPEARQELDRSLPLHPNSLALQDYQDSLDSGQTLAAEHKNAERPQNRIQVSGDYFADSAGNRGWRSSQDFDYQMLNRFSGRLSVDQRNLWQTGGPAARVVSGTNDLRLRLASFLVVDAGGGSVGFADGSSRALYEGELELHPRRHLWLAGGFARIPIYPTFQATQFNLLAEGWNTRINWQPEHWRLSITGSKQHYSDGNVAEREGGELIRWSGNAKLAVGPGYHFDHLNFTQTFSHGYFSPSQYQNHLGLLGIRFRLVKAFRAEYLAGAGAESVAGGAYQTAWEAALKNRVLLGRWEVGADYFYFHLAQASGAFRANAGRVMIDYRF
jgi:tetratricopeptide (TPR) repeat protein